MMMRRLPRFYSHLLWILLVFACRNGRVQKPDELGVDVKPGQFSFGVVDKTPKQLKHPRILLTPARLSQLKKDVAGGSPVGKRLLAECARYEGKDISGGYEALQWTEAMAVFSLCWHGTGKDSYGTQAVKYLTYLMRDRKSPGDGKGGAKVVQSDSGYAVRSYGAYTALGYDWLYDAPGMTDALKKEARTRLGEWIEWYDKEGYLNRNPYSNYFWGYMTALTYAAIAVDGESAMGTKWLERAHALMKERIVPGFSVKLKGGEWAEGWQYGQLVATEAAMVTQALAETTGVNYAKSTDWFSEVVDYHLHALHPDQRTAYGNGTRHQRPPKADPAALNAVLLVLDEAAPEKAAHARWILDNLYPPHSKKRIWVKNLVENPTAARTDPRTSLSHHASGPGMTFARSSWDEDAVWVSFQAGSKISKDHQHHDQGHVELWRGGEGLLVDGGGRHGYATTNHNSLLIDDGGKVLNYPPNQGIWGKAGKTEYFADTDGVVVAIGNIGDAYLPKCAPRGCDDRVLKQYKRSFVYVRPNTMIVFDEATLTDEEFTVASAFHVLREPTVQGAIAQAKIGESAVTVQSLTGDTKTVVKKEPTTGKEARHVYQKNTNPKGRPAWRIEVTSPKGQAVRRIFNWISVTTNSTPRVGLLEDVSGAVGAVGQVDGGEAIVAFAQGNTGTLTLPSQFSGKFILVGLQSVVVNIQGCELSFQGTKGSAAKVVNIDKCVLR